MSITALSPTQRVAEPLARKTARVLFLDCPTGSRAAIERELATADLRVVWADSSAAAAAELRRQDMPVLVSFSRGVAALKFINELRAFKPDLILFAVVEASRPDLVTEAVLANVADVVTPEVGGARLAAAIARETGHATIATTPAAATGTADFYAYSAAMRDACAAMTRAASGRSGVLIRGEAGSGRQLAAAAIHAAGEPTRTGRFIALDCAAADGQPLEQALFGTTTRSDEDGLPARGLERVSRTSVLHAANGGTLYLDNIQDASTRVQRRLARALRDRDVVLDDGAAVTFDVRCMTGADDGLAAAIQDGRVEDALAKRLSSIRIDLPSLRNRREDIPALANRFLRDACASLGIPAKMLSRSAVALLTALPWRGNVTELRALMETIAGRDGHRGVGVEDLLAHVRLDVGAITLSQSGTLRQARAQFEHEYIAAILRQHRGRITQAAKTLGIQRTNLYRKMRTLKVVQPRTR